MSAIKIRNKSILLQFFSTAVAIMLLGYAAYGWFAMSSEVRASGMDMTVVAPNSIEISATGPDTGYSSSVSVNLKSIVQQLTSTSENKFINNSENMFYLLPASSFDGISIWKTDKSDVNGNALCGDSGFENVSGANGQIQYHKSTSAFEGYYIDVPLWFRATSNQDLTLCLSRNGSNVTGDAGVVSIVRAALLNGDASASANTAETPLVFKHTSDISCPNVITQGSGELSKSVASDYIKFSGITGLSQKSVIVLPASISGGVSVHRPVKVTVRLWIEGQDNNCVPGVLNGIKTFSISLGFNIKDD